MHTLSSGLRPLDNIIFTNIHIISKNNCIFAFQKRLR